MAQKRPAKKVPVKKAPAKKAPAKRPSGRARMAAKKAPVKRPARKPGRVTAATGALVKSLRDGGDWDDRAAALAEVAVTLAATLDAGAGLSTAAVARELRATIKDLVPREVDDDELAFLADLSTPVGDAEES